MFYSLLSVLYSLYLWLIHRLFTIFNQPVKTLITRRFAAAGVTVDGPRQCDLKVHDDRFYALVAAYGPLGMGNSYVDGWWDCPRVDQLLERLIEAGLQADSPTNSWLYYAIYKGKRGNASRKEEVSACETSYDKIINEAQSRSELKDVSAHYYRDTEDEREAIMAKYDLIARKAKLRPGMRVLDIGCGYGSLLKYIAQHYDVECVGVNISQAQVQYGRRSTEGMRVDIRLMDFRELEEKFDRILCVEVVNHLGAENTRKLFEIVDRCLTTDGLFFVHAINRVEPGFPPFDVWNVEHLFPATYLPEVTEFIEHSRSKFNMEDVQSFGLNMDKSCLHWAESADSDWPLERRRLEPEQFRTLMYSNLSMGAAFRTRKLDIFHYVFTKRSNRTPYYGER